ncbi:MAG: DUF5906 domain-containing protein [Thermoleophilia bacterium]
MIEDKIQKKPSITEGLTVKELAKAKRLSLRFLRSLGVEDCDYRNSPAVKIPYNESTIRYRLRLKGDRFRWKKGSEVCLYGLERLDDEDAEKDEIILVEGESDSWTLWHHGFTALGIPGASNFKDERDGKHLTRYKKIYVVQEPDNGGDSLRMTLAESSIRNRLHIIKLDGFKDVSELHMADPDDFVKKFKSAMKKSKQLTEEQIAVGKEIDPVISQMNDEHAVVMLGGKCCILNEITDPIFNRDDITFSGISDIKNFYSNDKVHDPALDKKVNKAAYWLSHPDRRQYKGIVFAPPKDITAPDKSLNGYYNLYKGLAVEAREGNCKYYLRHIRSNISNGDKQIYEYILNWLADLFQHPGEKPGVSLVLGGYQGSGKGVFVNPILGIVGAHGLHVSHSKRITGGFNSHLKNALLVFADEAVWGGDKAAEGALKALVTEDQLSIEPKGFDAFMVKNYVRLIMASNNTWVCPAGLEERRFFVINVGTKHVQDSEYFKRIVDEMKNGGREALLYFLLNRDIKGVDLRKFPKTAALLEQKRLGMSAVEKFWFEILTSGSFDPEEGIWGDGLVGKEKLHEFYVKFTGDTGKQHKETSTELGMGLHKLVPSLKDERRQRGGSRQWFYQFPSLRECRNDFEKRIGQEIEWPETDDDEE